MPILTLTAKVLADEPTGDLLREAMLAATKVYNGVLWQLRAEYETTGQTDLRRGHLNGILKTLPRAKDYYSLSVQATRDEVIGAYHSFFALRAAGRTQHQAPGFRRKSQYSPLRYYNGYGFTLVGDRLSLSLGTGREDGVRSVAVRIQHRPNFIYRRIINVLLTYDPNLGLRAHLVVEVDAALPVGKGRVAVDLGETQAITAVFAEGPALLYSGRRIKSIRRYWQKVRAKVNPPSAGQRKSRRYRQIDRRESRQVQQLLQVMTTDFVRQCRARGVRTIAIGDLTGIRERIDYGTSVNQRLHAWPFAKVTELIRYKAGLVGISVIAVDEAYSSQRCAGCGLVRAANRVHRGQYRCACGWQAQADVNGAANLFTRAFEVSPLRGSGAVAAPVVVPVHLDWHTVHAKFDQAAQVA